MFRGSTSIGRMLLLCAFAGAVALVWTGLGPSGAAKSKPPTASVLAQRLVANIATARTPKARAAAVTDVFRALRIPVQTATGKPVSAYPEVNAARYLQLYDFEMRALADQYARGARTSLEDIAARLTALGIDLDGKPLPAGLLSEALRDGTRVALKKPTAGRELLPLVVRNLGLKHKFDTAKGIAATQKLDTIQGTLIVAAIAYPALRNITIQAARSRMSAVATDLPGFCAKLKEAIDKFQKEHPDEAKKIGKAGEQIVEVIKDKAAKWGAEHLPGWVVKSAVAIGAAAERIAPFVGALHGAALAYSTDVKALEKSLADVHWTHSGAPDTRTFRVKVTMLDDYGDLLVKCGDLAGIKLPPKGPVEGVWVSWTQQQATRDLKLLGKLDCTTALGVVCASKTGADGIARLVFTPKKEPIPGVGSAIQETGYVQGAALYQSASDSDWIGQMMEILAQKFDGTRWFVSRHQPPGYAFDAGPFAVDSAPRVTGRTCGEDPLGSTWTLRMMFGGRATAEAKRVFPPDLVIPNIQTGDPTSGNGLYDWETRIELLPDAAQVKVTLLPMPWPYDWGGEQTVPLTPDPSCPALG